MIFRLGESLMVSFAVYESFLQNFGQAILEETNSIPPLRVYHNIMYSTLGNKQWVEYNVAF